MLVIRDIWQMASSVDVIPAAEDYHIALDPRNKKCTLQVAGFPASQGTSMGLNVGVA